MAKRVTSSSVNWGFITETLLKVDRQKVIPLKVQYEKYLREMTSMPAELPKIDWNYYKARITIPGMVDSFQKNYEALKIPYPTDQGELSKVEATNTKANDFAKKKYEELLKEIQTENQKLKELEGIMNYSEMTLEEFYLARPDLKIDPDKPALWPQHMSDDSSEEEKH